jgi:protein-tyrosine phosphatase
MKDKPRVLFVCSRNKWRSPTAERIYQSDNRIDVRSAGLSGKSSHCLTKLDLDWADLVLVMEPGQRSRIFSMFGKFEFPVIKSLDIPDDYQFMDKELVELIRTGVEFHIHELEKLDE